MGFRGKQITTLTLVAATVALATSIVNLSALARLTIAETRSRAELLADNYFHAVQEAVKSVADKMRSQTGLSDDGATLVDRTLAGSPPMLAINPLSTASQRSEQSGFANLVRGTFGMFRNPTAHEARIHWAMSKEDAEDLLTIVSLIHRRLDAAHMPART